MSRRPRNQARIGARIHAFTLIEVMVVVAILAVLAALIVPKVMSRPDEARVVAARQDISSLLQALKLYRLDNLRYPTTEQGLAALVTLAWSSHVLFDWLGSDDTPPLGVMALWPFTSNFYFAYAYVFEAISRRTWLPNFWSHNLWAVATELMMLGPLTLVAVWWRRRVHR